MDHYQAVVKPGHGKEGGTNNVLALLAQGLTEDGLRACADRYAAACRAKGIEPKYRMKVRNFYGKAAAYQDFPDDRPGATTSANGEGKHDAAADMAAQREAWERERREAQEAGGMVAVAARLRRPAGPQEGGAA